MNMKKLLDLLAKLPNPAKIGLALIGCLLVLAIVAGLLAGKPKQPAKIAIPPATPTAPAPAGAPAPAPAAASQSVAAPAPAAQPAQPAAPLASAAPVITMRPAVKIDKPLEPGSNVAVGILQSDDSGYFEIEKAVYTNVGSRRDSAEYLSIGGIPEGFASYTKGQRSIQIERRGFLKIEKPGVYNIVITGEAEQNYKMMCVFFVGDMSMPIMSAVGLKITKIASLGLDAGLHDVAMRCAGRAVEKFSAAASIKGESDGMPKSITLQMPVADKPEKK
jgi:hypothetical protein